MNKRFYLTCLVLGAACGVQAQFVPGNLAVLRVGDGTQILINTGNSLYVDQYTPAGVLVNSVKVPDNGLSAMIISGTAGSEGVLTRSADRSSMLFSGYRANRGSAFTSLASYGANVINRGYGVVDSTGAYQMPYASTTMYSQNNTRGAAGVSGTNVWFAGANTGTYFAYPVTPVQTLVQTNLPDTRVVRIVASNLYFSVQVAKPPGVYTMGAVGHPKTPAGLATSLVTTNLVISTGVNSQPSDFAINPALSVAYVADMRSGISGGGIQKWTNSPAGGWTLAYTLGIGNTAFGAFGLTADFSGSNAVIYATTTEGPGGNVLTNRLVKIVDTNSAAKAVTVAKAGPNQAFRGVDFAPDLRPLILSQPQTQNTTNGAVVTFSVSDTSLYAVHFQWLFDGQSISSANSATLTLNGVTTNSSGNYSVVLSDAYGSVTSAVAQLAVTPAAVPPEVDSQPAGVSVYLGDNAYFSVAASGTPPLFYQWELGGSPLTGQTNTTLEIDNVSSNDLGSYSVVVSNSAGSTNSQAAILAALALPPPSFIPYTAAGQVYTQNFDSLPDPGFASVEATNPVTINNMTYSPANPFDFAFPVFASGETSGLGLAGTLDGWYGAGALLGKIGASDGSLTSGGIISFGPTKAPTTNRALGLLATVTSGATAFGARFLNQTSNSLAQINVEFTGQLWRQQTNAKILSFSYFVDPSGQGGFPTNATAILTNLDVFFPTNNSHAENGESSTNQVMLSATNVPITNWPSGGALWLIWRMTNSGGNGQGLAIDDFQFSATAPAVVVPPALSIQHLGGDVEVFWSASETGFTLETTSGLPAGSGGWSPVTQPAVVTNGFNTVTIPISPGRQFFRLGQ